MYFRKCPRYPEIVLAARRIDRLSIHDRTQSVNVTICFTPFIDSLIIPTKGDIKMTNTAYTYDNIVPFNGNTEPVPEAAPAPVAGAAAPVAAAAAAIYTQPGVSQEWASICKAWDEIFGAGGIPIPIAKWIHRLIESGMEPALVVRAIEETAWAKRPSPSYFRGILNRCISAGIMTAFAYDQHEAERDLQYQKRSQYINSNDSIF